MEPSEKLFRIRSEESGAPTTEMEMVARNDASGGSIRAVVMPRMEQTTVRAEVVQILYDTQPQQQYLNRLEWWSIPPAHQPASFMSDFIEPRIRSRTFLPPTAQSVPR